MIAAPFRASARPLAALLILLAPACGGDGDTFAFNNRSRTSAGTVEPELKGPVVIAAPKDGYRVAPVATPASVSGRAMSATPVPAPEPIATAGDSVVCGATLPDSSLVQKDSGLGGVVVWLEGVRSGKALPVEKRIELESNHCLLSPRVQAAVAGSAVNVIGHDAFRQHLRFLAAGDSAARATILLGKDEQVIPSELPAKAPGLVIVRDVDHAWPRAFLAVFDHPYFAVTKPDGSFSIEGVPPGKYTLVAWHERAGRTEQAVELAPNAKATVRLELRIQGK